MLPPIPHSLAPVAAHQDVIKPRPDIPAVTPVKESAKESALSMDKRHPQETEELLREEQRRQQRRYYSAVKAEAAAAEQNNESDIPGLDLDQLPRQGLWVDVEV